MEKAEAFKAKLESLDVSQFAPKVTQALTQIQNGVSTVWGYIQPVLSYIVQNAGTMIPLIFKIVTAVSALSVIASIATNIISFVSAAKTAITVIKRVGGRSDRRPGDADYDGNLSTGCWVCVFVQQQ